MPKRVDSPCESLSLTPMARTRGWTCLENLTPTRVRRFFKRRAHELAFFESITL